MTDAPKCTRPTCCKDQDLLPKTQSTHYDPLCSTTLLFGSAIVAVVVADTKELLDEVKSSEMTVQSICILKCTGIFTTILEIVCHGRALPELTRRGRLDKNGTDKLDLTKLRAHVREKPRTKAGQVRQAWPDIKQLLASGHSLKDICLWLNEIGVQIGYARLSDYVCQLRRKESSTPLSSSLPTSTEPAIPDRNVDPVHPLAHILEREKRNTGFTYNAEPDPKKLI